jgi:hypothetical protein
VITETTSEAEDEKEVVGLFERSVGVTNVSVERTQVGQKQFIKFKVGRDAPLYRNAIFRIQKELSEENIYRGAVGLSVDKQSDGAFPGSLEASALRTLISRSTREVSQGGSSRGLSVPHIPFPNREDHQLAQPATHIVRGRRGVGKSTLIGRAVEILTAAGNAAVVLDMQGYSTLTGDELVVEVMADICRQLGTRGTSKPNTDLMELSEKLLDGSLQLQRVPPTMKRIIGDLTRELKDHVFVFLDDYHLIDHDSQPLLLHYLHACLKGANGWLKVAGLSSLLNTYAPGTRQGLQVPGDAQIISLDLTLENPEAAEAHLRAILESFLNIVGFKLTHSVIPPVAFRRLVWATAGVPRDFLQMFARSAEHARRNKHHAVTISDVNVTIGEFGQEKMNDLKEDARNSADELSMALSQLESLCLDERKINAFLVRSESSKTRDIVRSLSDLRMIHLIHQAITPDRAGERYEAYIIDYSIFTGFRRRRNVKEMVPTDQQFKAADLRRLPKFEIANVGSGEG